MNKEQSQSGKDREEKSQFYKEADSLDEWKERKEERKSLGWAGKVRRLGYYTIKSSRETFHKKEEKDGGTDPDVNKRLCLRTFFGSVAPER